MSASTKSSDNMADKILKKLKSLDEQLTSLIKLNSEKIGQLLEITGGLKKDSEDKKKVEAELIKLQTQLDNVKKESEETKQDNENLQKQLGQLKKIDDQVGELEKTVKTLITNNDNTQIALDSLNTLPPTKGGFQYNKKHPKHKRPFRLFSRSNSKTTSKKSKKQRRRPGKSVKKGGMKTRRRRRNKKSKKSKKRRK